MVQTDAQYVFIHDALLEDTLSGDTEVSAELLQQHMEKLQAVDTDGEDGYKREFQVNQILMSKSNKYVWHPMLGELLAGAF